MAEDNKYIETITKNTNAESFYNNSSNIPATKQFVVNATGNIFIATTLSAPETPENISDEAKEAFGQVSVFFAAMTKAMSEAAESLYDYEALNKLIEESGLFVNMTQSTVKYESSNWGLTFSNELIQGLLGLSGDLRKIAQSLRSLIGTLGKEGFKFSRNKDATNKKIGTIVFVCEYLMGAVSITPLVFYIETEKNKKSLEVGPCFSQHSEKLEVLIEKEVHMFVPPKFIKHASELNKAMNDPEFNDLVESMKKSIASNTKASTDEGDATQE